MNAPIVMRPTLGVSLSTVTSSLGSARRTRVSVLVALPECTTTRHVGASRSAQCRRGRRNAHGLGGLAADRHQQVTGSHAGLGRRRVRLHLGDREVARVLPEPQPDPAEPAVEVLLEAGVLRGREVVGPLVVQRARACPAPRPG